MKSTSKPVIATSRANEEDLIKIARRFDVDTYKRPIEDEEWLTSTILKAAQGRSVILDSGCGIGESTYHLGKLYPEHLVLGVDKSASRIERKNAFKQELAPNTLLLQADMQSVWPLLYKLQSSGELSVSKQYILFPNPWPKAKGLKKRWYANPMLAYITALNTPIEARSNWKGYLEDFLLVLKGLGKGEGVLESYEPSDFITPFERKYSESGQELYKLVFQPSLGEPNE